MCLGIPGEVIEIVDADEHLAKVDVSGVRRTISVKLLEKEDLQVGDWVLVHVGFAMAKIDAAEAAVTLEQIRLLGQEFTDEIEAFKTSSVL